MIVLTQARAQGESCLIPRPPDWTKQTKVKQYFMAIGGQIGWIKSSELTVVFVFKRSLTALWNSINALCNHRCKTQVRVIKSNHLLFQPKKQEAQDDERICKFLKTFRRNRKVHGIQRYPSFFFLLLSLVHTTTLRSYQVPAKSGLNLKDQTEIKLKFPVPTV